MIIIISQMFDLIWNILVLNSEISLVNKIKIWKKYRKRNFLLQEFWTRLTQACAQVL